MRTKTSTKLVPYAAAAALTLLSFACTRPSEQHSTSQEQDHGTAAPDDPSHTQAGTTVTPGSEPHGGLSASMDETTLPEDQAMAPENAPSSAPTGGSTVVPSGSPFGEAPAESVTASPEANLHAGPAPGANELTTAQIVALQAALNREGGSVPTNGVIGAETRAALEKFQKDNGLTVTGGPSAETLSRLGIEAH